MNNDEPQNDPVHNKEPQQVLTASWITSWTENGKLTACTLLTDGRTRGKDKMEINKNMPLLHSKAILWSFSHIWDSCVDVLVVMSISKYLALLLKHPWCCWCLSVQMCCREMQPCALSNEDQPYCDINLSTWWVCFITNHCLVSIQFCYVSVFTKVCPLSSMQGNWFLHKWHQKHDR